MSRMDDLESRIEELEVAISNADASTREKLQEVLKSLKANRKIMVACATCKGEGRVTHEYHDGRRPFTNACGACRGVGRVEASTDENGNLIVCATCKGEGRVTHEYHDGRRPFTNACGACRGRGYA